jgi:endonuclease YncB( thermonuclease family)
MKCVHPDVGESNFFANAPKLLLKKMKTKDKLLVGWATGLVSLAVVLAFSTRHDAKDDWVHFPTVQEPNVTGEISSRLVGRVDYVVDGDTIDIHRIRIRLNGIDAPEHNQTCETAGGGNFFDQFDDPPPPRKEYPCGQRATIALRDFLGSRVVSCQQTGTDRFGRVLATCSVDGADIGEWMVSQGWAIAYRKYSFAYVQAEEQARTEKRGIWAGTFLNPEQVRKNRALSR